MMSCSKDLLDNISQFCRLYLSDDVESDFIERSLKGLEDVWKLLRDIIEVVTVHNFYVDAELNLLLEELNEIITKANELAECWHKGMSKIYFVLQFESLASKLQTKLTETCGAISALFRSFGMDSDVETVELCMSKARYITDQQISVIIKDAIQDQMKNALPISEHMSKIEGCLSLSTNQELLLELIALDKIKSEISGDNLAEVEYVDHLIALVTHLHNSYVFKHQVHSINNIPVPVDFCCPLSLELMSDPVMVASGQTYERAFIIRWLDQGFTVCPKTRQSLGHTNLIPNYTVKAWIASWCETNNIKLSDRTKTLNDHEHHISSDHKYLLPKSPEHDGFVMTSRKPPCYSDFPPETEKKSSLLGHSSLSPEDRSSTDKNQLHLHEAKVTSLELLDVDSVGQSSNQLLSSYLAGLKPKGDSRDNSAYNTLDNDEDTGVDGDAVSRMANSPYSSNDASAETKSEFPALTTPSKAPEFLSRLSELRVRNQTIWRRASDRFSPRIISSSMDARSDLAGVETQIRKLIEGLKSDSIEEQRNAATELRVLARHNTQNRIVIAHCGAVTHLVSLLYSSDQTVQENAVTALLNLSIDDNNKISIANAEAIDPLIHVLETGNPEAKENAAATLFSLSVNEENKARIGRSGAIVPLVDLLADGTPRGKRDAAIALFNLSIFHENKIRIVQAGAVKHLVELMEPAAGMVDKAVAVLSNLSTIPEGRSAIGYENGIPILVEVVELGSARGKEYAAAALLQLCTNSSRFCNLVLQEGAVPPLVALSQSGTPRGKEKAQLLLSYFRNKRHGNSRGT